MFDPKSPMANAISDVFVIILILGGLVFALVTFLVIYALVKFRRRDRNDLTEPRQVHGNTRLEIAWTIGPALIAAGLVVLTVIGIANADPGTPKDRQPDIKIIGHQWWWEYQYPAQNVITANEVHIPVGQRMFVSLQSADVIHDFWVPQLGRKMDLFHEWPNHTWLEADVAATYLGACAEYCGTQHAGMLIRVIAEPQDKFNAWIQQQQTVPPAPTDASAQRGQQIFLQQTCVNCHNISGTAAQARVGPDLTHLGSRETIGSGVVKNTPENLTKWIRNPNDIKPGVSMPQYQLNDQDLRDLVAYLEANK